MNARTGDTRLRRESLQRRMSALAHRIRVTAGLRADPKSDAIRTSTLAVTLAATFAIVGSMQPVPLADWLVEAPFNPDLALRAVAHGWFESARTRPVTIVEIDEETHRGWGSPATTPRDQLAHMLRVVTDAGPGAVVLDIDLSGGRPDEVLAEAGSRELHEFLARYAGPAPIVLPRRVEPGHDGSLRPASSPFDDLVARHPQLSWAHARFETADGGAVRTWQPWLGVCTETGFEWLPAVATTVASITSTSGPGPAGRAPLPPPDGSCAVAEPVDVPAQRLLIGPRITGDQPRAPRHDAQAIPAALLLDRDVARDDARLFGGRVVLIGSTHPAAGDSWLTVSGVVSGVELLASTVRYAPLQAEARSTGAQLGYRAVALLVFALFVVAGWRYRGLGVVLVVVFGVLATVAVLLALFDSLVVFDALEAAILLAIAYKVLESLFEFVAEFKLRRPRYPPGIRGWSRTLWAGWRREHDRLQ